MTNDQTPPPPPPPPAAPQFAEGWYPDGSGTTRWWDGQQWTGHVYQQPGAAVVAPATAAAQPPIEGTSPVAAFVLGLIGLLVSGAPLIGLALSITGVILGSGAQQKMPVGYRHRGFATAGVVLGVIGIVGSVILTIRWIVGLTS